MHGFPDQAASYFPLARRLVAAGWRVVLPALRGYPPSPPLASPFPPLGPEGLAADLLEWADRPAWVVGHDWGALAGYAAAAKAPERLLGLLALALPPPRVFLRGLGRAGQAWQSRYMLGFQLPGSAARLRRSPGWVRRLWRRWSPTWEPSPGLPESVEAALAPPGVLEGALGYYRALLQDPARHPRAFARSWALCGEPLRVPTRIVAGEEDRCIGPQAFCGWEAAFLPAARVRLSSLPGVGHFLGLEAPAVVVAALEDLRAEG